MAERVSCEQCPIYQGFRKDDGPAVAAAIHEYAPEADPALVQQVVESEVQTRHEVLAGAESCLGYRPMSGFLRSVVYFFDGKSGLSFAENTRCANPVHQDPEFRKRKVESRTVLNKLLSE